MAPCVALREAVDALIQDGDVVALEGCAHLTPFAAGHEIARAGKRNLTLVRIAPDLIGDQLIGMGRVAKLVFAWSANPDVGPLHRFRDAVEHGWPRPLAVEERRRADMVNAYVAGAAGLPFAVMRGLAGSDLPGCRDRVRFVQCPFTGEEFAAVASIRPDVTVIHAQQADRQGNVLIWGILGVQKEAVLAAKRVIVTVEEIVDELEIWPNACVLPAWAITAVCHVPGGAWPSYTQGYGERDDRFYRVWDEISRDRETFRAWMQRYVLDTEDMAGFRRVLTETARGQGSGKAGASTRRGYSADEMMTVAAARMLRNGAVCLVGTGLPTTAADLARLTHAPDLALLRESDTTGMVEICRYWVQGGRIGTGLLEAAQIDRFGNLNNSIVGSAGIRPAVRLPGAGSGPEIAGMAGEVLIIMRHDRRRFVDKLDFVTAAGHLDGGEARGRAGLPGKGPVAIVTDLGILTPDPVTKEFTLTSLHPGVTLEQVRAATGWDLKVADDLARTKAPTPQELALLRSLHRQAAGLHAEVAA